MTANDIVQEFIRHFNELSIPYMLVGSFSSNFYGRPRSTKDADFVLQCSDSAISQLRTKLPRDYRFDPQMSFEGVTGTSRYIVEHASTSFKIELFLLGEDPHDLMRFARKQRWVLGGLETWLPTAEDVIVMKLRWSQNKNRVLDIEDVRYVLAVQTGKLDLHYIRHWCDQHTTRELFERLLRESVV